MSLSARQSRLHLEIGGAGFSVLGLCGNEELNRPFAFDVSVLADSFAVLSDRLGAPVALFMTAPDGYERRLNGVLTEAKVEADLADGRSIVCLSVESRLVLLQQRTDSRLILSETLPDILRQTLCRNSLAESTLRFGLAREYPLRPSTLQAQENDLEFLLRLIGRQGVFVWSDAKESDEILHIADTTNHCPMLAREVLTYLPGAGLETRGGSAFKVGMLSIEDRAELVSGRYWVHDVHETAPEHPMLAGRATTRQSTAAAETHHVSFGSGVATEKEAKHEALIRAQRADCIRHTLTISSHAADLRVGALIRLDTSGYSEYLSGDYLITAVEHRARQYGGLGAGLGQNGQADCPYTNTATLIRRETPWRPEVPPVHDLPLIFSARIESRDPIPELDGAGRYRYRQYSDSNQAAHAEASASVRRLQPYASPGETMPVGWHLPLHDDNEVLISCLNNDPDRPMLAGTLANPAHRSVVTAENAHQNRLLTAGGNDLTMDDWRDKSAISLCTFAGHNMLHLNADVLGHRVNLVSSQGQMEWYAKKTIATRAGDTLTETVGNDRLQQIENRHSTTTNKKEVHLQAATDGEISAGNNIQMESGKNIELTAGQDLHLDISEATRIHVNEQDAVIHVDSGSLTIQADGAITIEGDGQGTITFEQSGGGFSMAPNGDITMFGDAISFTAENSINFYGPVSKEVTAPDAAPVAVAAQPLKPEPLVELKFDEKSKPDLVIGVFFDGTGNNMMAEPADRHTNVAKLLPLYSSAIPPIYIQGVGTKAVRESDGSLTQDTSALGLGMGLGLYGGETRLKEARERVWGALQKYHAEYGPPETVVFDVFGFSRGAMLARHFVNMVHSGLPNLAQAPIAGQSRIFPDLREAETATGPPSPFALAPEGRLYPRLEAEVRVRFLGIFDSVGSFYWPGDDDEGFINGNLAKGSADFIYHPVARDEVRHNFPLTSIAPGLSAAMEETLFGVHSDIGGGYGLDPERFYLGQATYYQPDFPRNNLGINDPSWCAEMQRKARETGQQNGIECAVEFSSNSAQFFEIRPTNPDLSKVALKAMHDKAVAQGVPLEEIKVEDKIPLSLIQLIERARRGDVEALKHLDDEYIHTSHRKLAVLDLRNTIGMYPAEGDMRKVFPNRPERAILP